MNNDVRVWRFAVLGFSYGDLRVVSRYYKSRWRAENWLERHASSVGVYLIQTVNIPTWMAEQK